MKQSTGRLQGARWFTRESGLGVAAAVVAGLAACGGNNQDNCHNVPQAVAELGQPNYNLGTGNTKGISASTLNAPVGAIAIDGNDAYLADSANNRILHFPSTALTAGTLGGAADFAIGQPDLNTVQQNVATSNLTFASPSKVAIGNSGSTTYMAVADSGNNRVLIWSGLPQKSTDAPVAVLGQPDFVSDLPNGGSATPTAATLSNPTGVSIWNGFLVVADKGNNRVLIWKGIPTSAGVAADVELGQTASNSSGTVDCTSNTGYCFGTNVAAIDQFPSGAKAYTLAMNGPTDVWAGNNKLLVADTNNHRILAWSSIPLVNNLLANGLIGASQFGATSLNGGSGTQALHSPDGVTSDGSAVFVADSINNRVLQYQAYLTSTPLGFAATYVYGQQDFTHITANDPDQNNQIGDQRNNPVTNGITQGTFFLPEGVTVTSNNQIFITDTANSRVMQFTLTKSDGTPTGVDGSDTQDANFCF